MVHRLLMRQRHMSIICLLQDGTPFINASAAYEYHLFVARKDEEKAKQVLRSAGVK